MSKEEITSNYAFDPRQTNYYTDAGRYLGLVEKKSQDTATTFCLSSEGKKIMRLKYKKRQLKFVEMILKHKVYHDVLMYNLQNGIMPSAEKIIEIMKSSNLYNVIADSTFERRASTISGWTNWILDLQR